MSQEPVRVWLALDPELGQLRILLNGQPVGKLVSLGGQMSLDLNPEHAEIRDDLAAYCSALFGNMTETLRSALYEAPGFLTNTMAREAMAAVPAERKRRVHLGCGGDVRAGWLNVDYRPGGGVGYDEASGFLNFDLRQGLPPLEDGSVDMVFSSHFFEHLRHEEAINLMRDCRRVLKDGGVARFQMPDFAMTFKAYCEADPEYLEAFRSTHKLLDHMPEFSRNYADLVSRSVYEYYTHKYIWDVENLSLALKAVGFSDVQVDDHRDEFDHPSSVRRDYSYYLTATA